MVDCGKRTLNGDAVPNWSMWEQNSGQFARASHSSLDFWYRHTSVAGAGVEENILKQQMR